MPKPSPSNVGSQKSSPRLGEVHYRRSAPELMENGVSPTWPGADCRNVEIAEKSTFQARRRIPDTESGSRATRVGNKSSSPSLSDICFPADVDGGWPNGRGID